MRRRIRLTAMAATAAVAAGLVFLGFRNDRGREDVKYIETGKASWYGPGFHGRKTASGENFNQHKATAAHPELPLGSKATVTNLANERSVEVEVNDRGPYVKGRKIDLSKEAARELDMLHGGTARVRIEATGEQLDPDADGKPGSR